MNDDWVTMAGREVSGQRRTWAETDAGDLAGQADARLALTAGTGV